jgi:hypothetical protein
MTAVYLNAKDPPAIRRARRFAAYQLEYYGKLLKSAEVEQFVYEASVAWDYSRNHLSGWKVKGMGGMHYVRSVLCLPVFECRRPLLYALHVCPSDCTQAGAYLLNLHLSSVCYIPRDDATVH